MNQCPTLFVNESGAFVTDPNSPLIPGVRLECSDMLDSKNVIVAHGCNAQGAMGSGAALAVIQKYPANKKTYQDRHKQQPLQLGEVIWHVESKYNRAIANCITQEFAGADGRRYVDYDAILESYNRVANVALQNQYNAIATCQVGSGLAGGNWTIILGILEQVALTKGITIVVHQPDPKRFEEACKQYVRYAHAQRPRAEATTN